MLAQCLSHGEPNHCIKEPEPYGDESRIDQDNEEMPKLKIRLHSTSLPESARFVSLSARGQ